jgi:hypothetical protein
MEPVKRQHKLVAGRNEIGDLLDLAGERGIEDEMIGTWSAGDGIIPAADMNRDAAVADDDPIVAAFGEYGARRAAGAVEVVVAGAEVDLASNFAVIDDDVVGTVGVVDVADDGAAVEEVEAAVTETGAAVNCGRLALDDSMREISDDCRQVGLIVDLLTRIWPLVATNRPSLAVVIILPKLSNVCEPESPPPM